MLILVNKSTGAVRPAPAADTIGPQAADEDEILIDSTHQIYKPETGEVVEVPPWTPQVPADFPSRLEALESRIATLEAQLAHQADSLLGVAVTIEYLVHLTGKTLSEVIEEARERIKTIEAARAAQAEEPYTDEEQEQKSGGD